LRLAGEELDSRLLRPNRPNGTVAGLRPKTEKRAFLLFLFYFKFSKYIFK
jgi:hypothetical protein